MNVWVERAKYTLLKYNLIIITLNIYTVHSPKYEL